MMRDGGEDDFPLISAILSAMKQEKKLNLLETMAIAIGTMIGASIFSIFGLGVQIAGKWLPIAFLLSGIYAFAVAYSYATLGGKIISNEGPMAFIFRAFGKNTFSGTLSVLMWLSYVVSIALFAKGFAGYFLPLFHIAPEGSAFVITEITLILFFTALNFFGSKAVGKSEFWIVLGKLAILAIFIVGGVFSIKKSLLLPESFNGTGVLNASLIFFLSYMGFGLVTNASENVKNPERTIPRAIYWSIVIVMIFYLLISLVTIGSLPISEIISAQENALAVAALPFLGTFGFLLVSVGALLSTSSALNATIFGGANVAYALAKDGELPKFFERKVWFGSIEGLYITVAIGILLDLFFDLNAAASVTAIVYTVIYIAVLFSHLKLAKQYGGKKWLIRINTMLISFVFFALLVYQWNQHRLAFYVSIALFLGAFLMEFLYFRFTRRQFTQEKATEEK